MFEIFKIIWELFVAREYVRKGQLTLRKTLISTGLVLLGYLILVPASVLYQNHPEYKPLFIAAMVLAGIDFLFLFGLGIYWWRQTLVRQS
ncbi:MAG TPA: hypothetical protein VGG56_11915 [Terracidiphilus sp.]